MQERDPKWEGMQKVQEIFGPFICSFFGELKREILHVTTFFYFFKKGRLCMKARQGIQYGVTKDERNKINM